MISRFYPNCTYPPSPPVFVGGSNIRSTTDIAWGCLSIITLCTWSILHLNVPPQHNPAGRMQRIRRVLFIASLKIKWFIWAVFAPELTLGRALSDYCAASKSSKMVREEDWTIAHSFYADMGGFAVRWLPAAAGKHDAGPGTPSGPAASCQGSAEWTRAFNVFQQQAIRTRHRGTLGWEPHAAHAAHVRSILSREGEALINSFQLNLIALSGTVWVLSTDQLIEARKIGLIPGLMVVSEDEVNDKSKGDPLLKLLALVQVFWLVAQLISRAAAGKPSSQLEIMTLAYALCALIAYLLLLSRPRDVATPTVIPARRKATLVDVWRVASRGPVYMYDHRPYYTMPNSAHQGRWFDVGTFIGLLVFGCTHLLSWNFAYPTSLEKYMWRAAALSTIVLPLIAAPMFSGNRGEKRGLLRSVVCWVAAWLFVVGRLFLIVEGVRSTLYLEPGVYAATWTDNIPHVA